MHVSIYKNPLFYLKDHVMCLVGLLAAFAQRPHDDIGQRGALVKRWRVCVQPCVNVEFTQHREGHLAGVWRITVNHKNIFEM